MAKILVTGGAGFIGSHLVEALLRRGHRVVVVDNLATGKLENLAGVRDEVELLIEDIRNPEALRLAMQGVEVVFHEAALGSVPRSVADPLTSHEVNAGGTLKVLIAARDAGVSRVVYAASSSAYGDTAVLPKVESIRPLPLSPYAVSKLAGEAYMLAFHRTYGIETISLRYFNVFGPRQDPHSQYAAVIPNFVRAALNGDPVVIHGDGEQTRDFTFVENAVQANLLALEAPKVAGETVNIACGGRTSLNLVFATVCELVGRPCEAVHSDPRPGDVRHSLADISLAGSVLGYRPVVSFRDGLSRTVEWYRERLSQPGAGEAEAS